MLTICSSKKRGTSRKPAEIAAILFRRAETFLRRELRPEERIGVERRLVVLVAHVDDLFLEDGAEHLVVDLLFRRQLLQRNLVELGERLLPVLETLLLGGSVDARQMIVVRVASDFARHARISFCRQSHSAVVQRLETLIGLIRRGLSEQRSGRRQQQGERAAANVANGHRRSPAHVGAHWQNSIRDTIYGPDASQRRTRFLAAAGPVWRRTQRFAQIRERMFEMLGDELATRASRRLIQASSIS